MCSIRTYLISPGRFCFCTERVSVCVCVCPLCVFLLALSCQTVPASLCLPLSYLTLPSLSTLGDGNQSDRTHATICPSSMATSCPPRHRERLFVFAAREFVWTQLSNKGIADPRPLAVSPAVQSHGVTFSHIFFAVTVRGFRKCVSYLVHRPRRNGTAP